MATLFELLNPGFAQRQAQQQALSALTPLTQGPLQAAEGPPTAAGEVPQQFGPGLINQQQAEQLAGLLSTPGTRQIAGGLLGAIAPQLQRPAQAESPFAKVDPNKFTPQSLSQFQQTGDFGALQPIREAGGTEGLFAKVNPANFTQESIAQFQQSGDFSTLQPLQGEGKTFSNAQGLRKEFTALSKDFKLIRDSFKRIKSVAEKPSAAGDLAMIFNFMKMLDPGSTVREGEFATAQNAAGVPERVRALFNNVQRGERLTETTRGDFLTQSENLMNAQLSGQLELENQFTGLSQRAGVNPQNAVIDFVGDLRPQAIPPLPTGFQLVPGS